MLLHGKCDDIDECSERPCHSSAVCKNYPGSFVCACPDGLVGDPISTGCRNPEECLTNTDCPDTAACINSRCKNPCDSADACGLNAQCTVNAHHAFCKCPSNSRGDPSVECRLIECSENTDCPHSKSCLDSKCVNPCTIPNACGQNSNCVVENHVGICSCEPGTTGNPYWDVFQFNTVQPIINVHLEQFVRLVFVQQFVHQIVNVLLINFAYKEFVNQLVMAIQPVLISNSVKIIFAHKKFDAVAMMIACQMNAVKSIHTEDQIVKMLAKDALFVGEMPNVQHEIIMVCVHVYKVLLMMVKVDAVESNVKMILTVHRINSVKRIFVN